MICMSSIGLLYTLDLVSFLEKISTMCTFRKKQMSVIMETKWLLDGHEKAIKVQNIELRYTDDCGVHHRVFS